MQKQERYRSLLLTQPLNTWLGRPPCLEVGKDCVAIQGPSRLGFTRAKVYALGLGCASIVKQVVIMCLALVSSFPQHQISVVHQVPSDTRVRGAGPRNFTGGRR